MSNPSKYIATRNHMRKPADVTRKLVMAHEKLIPFDRDSLKGGVARILAQAEVVDRINKYFDENLTLATYDLDLDDIVSVLVC